MVMGEIGRGGQHKPIGILKEQSKLILEICHFTEDLNPLWSTKRTVRWLKELNLSFQANNPTPAIQKELFEAACHFFFEELGFTPDDKHSETLKNCLLPEVISNKKGPTPLLMLFFCSFLEEIGIRCQISSCRKRYLLKVQLDDRTHVVDFKNQCQNLDPHEIVELINSGFDFSSGSLESDILVVEYLNHLKDLSRRENKLHILSLVHSYLMRYQPFNLKHLSERARVAFETGDYQKALDDIRSYFNYKQPEFTNIDLKRMYKAALKKERTLKRKISNTFSDTIKSL